MIPEQLRLLVAEGEGLSVEFKEKYTPKIDRDIVAFANTKGGGIILGVSDDGKITGESLTNKLKAEIVDLARKCEPSIEIRKISRCIGNYIISYPPCFLRKQSRGAAKIADELSPKAIFSP